MDSTSTQSNTQSTPSRPLPSEPDLARIQGLLKSKDDTQRFVGLALLKSVLDNSEQLRQDEATVKSLWANLSPRFLDRLLRTGSKPASQNPNAKDMLDLVVSVLHTFGLLLPGSAASDEKFLNRIPRLVEAVLYSSEETTKLILQLLHTLVNSPQGCKVFVGIEDNSPLTEIAPTHAGVLDIFLFAWLNAMTAVEDPSSLSGMVDKTIQSLASSFTGTDAVTLLEFLGLFLRNADERMLPVSAKWLKQVIVYIQNLVTSRPTPEARSAYTNAAASVLKTYRTHSCPLLFINTTKEKKQEDFSYLFIKLLLIDIRSSLPTLLEQLNKPEYPKTSRRLTSAFDIISIFLGYLFEVTADDESTALTDIMSLDKLLKLRQDLGDTVSLTLEYLRDRWDASTAGAMGLHAEARTTAAEGEHFTLTWDSLTDRADEDAFVLAAVRAAALWIREDDGSTLRKEASGLVDMFMDLYKASASSTNDKLDFRSPVLVALCGIVNVQTGRDAILAHDGWALLSKDLVALLHQIDRRPRPSPAAISQGMDIIAILEQLLEPEEDVEEPQSNFREAWMDLVTAVAAWDCTPAPEPWADFQKGVMELCLHLASLASAGVKKRYKHSIDAIEESLGCLRLKP